MKLLEPKTSGITHFLSARRTLVFILMLFLPLAYLFSVFYLYAANIEALETEQRKKISINREGYDRAIENLRQRELDSAQELSKTYIDPFGR